MSTIKLTIPGKPIAKKRPRFVRKGNFVATYSAQKKEEKEVRKRIKEQLKDHKPFTEAVFLDICFNMPIPKGTSKKKVARMLSGELRHTKKADIDNLIKFICDCMNGLAWADDSQIAWIEAKKQYATTPETRIVMFEMED